MSLLETLVELYPRLLAKGSIVSIVGGGGKTSALFALAAGYADALLSVAATTTTHIRDPRLEGDRRFDSLILDPILADAEGEPEHRARPGAGIHVVASRAIPEDGRLAGIHPSRALILGRSYDIVLVEADGSKGLPVKAPAAHEPVVPADSSLVIGMIGLDCLARAMDGATVHRSELFGPLVGCAPGRPIGAAHLQTLAASPMGLFKDCPERSTRVLVLNKADALGPSALSAAIEAFSGAAPPGVDAVIACSLRLGTSRLLTRGC